MIKEAEKIYTDFSYTDEFGQTSRLTKDYNRCVLEDTTPLEFLVEEFKNFLLAAGYLPSQVDSLQFVEKQEVL